MAGATREMEAVGESVAAAAGRREAMRGVLHALAAYGLWGGNPLFFSLLAGASAFEVTAHRALWSLPTTLLLLVALRRLGPALRLLRRPATARVMVLSALFIGTNWGFFVWAVQSGQTMEASLGYYINPLMNVVVGFLLLGERFSRLQLLAIALATAAVVWLTVSVGRFPWLALLLAVSFTSYGFLRKTMTAGPLEGLFAESVVLSLLALPLLWWLDGHGVTLAFGRDATLSWLLAACGPVTVAPLLFFAAAARRIRLSTLGLLQYVAPTLMFLTAVVIFGDPFDGDHLIAFVLIWTALALYSFDTLRQRGRPEAAGDAGAEEGMRAAHMRRTSSSGVQAGARRSCRRLSNIGTT